MLDTEASQKDKLEEEIAVLKSQLMQLSLDADEVGLTADASFYVISNVSEWCEIINFNLISGVSIVLYLFGDSLSTKQLLFFLNVSPCKSIIKFFG